MAGHCHPLGMWSVLPGIDKHTSHFRRFWHGRVDRSVEEILEERGESPEEILAYLAHSGAPLIKIDDTTQIPAEKTLMILGSETQRLWRRPGRPDRSLHCGYRQPPPHQSALHVHGINPLDGLMQSKAWKKPMMMPLSRRSLAPRLSRYGD